MKSLLLFIFLFSINNISIGQTDANFQRNDGEEHYLLLTMPNRKGDINDVRTEATKYVWNTDSQKDWNLTHILIGPEAKTNAFLVKSFVNGKVALAFFDKMNEQRPDFLQAGLTEKAWIIGKSNYEELIRSKNLEQYERFFYFNYVLERQ